MAKYKVVLDMTCTTVLHVEADNADDAEEAAIQKFWEDPMFYVRNGDVYDPTPWKDGTEIDDEEE